MFHLLEQSHKARQSSEPMHKAGFNLFNWFYFLVFSTALIFLIVSTLNYKADCKSACGYLGYQRYSINPTKGMMCSCYGNDPITGESESVTLSDALNESREIACLGERDIEKLDITKVIVNFTLPK